MLDMEVPGRNVAVLPTPVGERRTTSLLPLLATAACPRPLPAKLATVMPLGVEPGTGTLMAGRNEPFPWLKKTLTVFEASQVTTRFGRTAEKGSVGLPPTLGVRAIPWGEELPLASG